MRELWQKTTQLFWQYPILWLPVFAADLVGFCLIQLQLWLSHRLIVWLVTRNSSVLGTAPNPVMGPEVLKITFLAAPLLWGRYLACILHYMIALLVTARIVQSVWGSEQSTSSWQWPRFRSMVILAVKVLVLYAGTSALGLWALRLIGRGFLTTPVLVWIFALFVSMVIVYVMTPSGLALLSEDAFQPSSGINTGRKLELARICGFLAVLASIAIGIFCNQVMRISAERSHTGVPLWMNAIASLLVAFPYCPLFISYSLIALNPE